MRIQTSDSFQWPARIAGIALVAACAASIAISIVWIPTSLGSPRPIVAPAELLSAAGPRNGPAEGLPDTRRDNEKYSDGAVIRLIAESARPGAASGSDLRADPGKPVAAAMGNDVDVDAVDLVLFLDWHMTAGGGYRSALDGLSCATRPAEAAPAPTRTGEKL